MGNTLEFINKWTGLQKISPTRDASPPLEIAFGGSIWCLKKRKH